MWVGIQDELVFAWLIGHFTRSWYFFFLFHGSVFLIWFLFWLLFFWTWFICFILYWLTVFEHITFECLSELHWILLWDHLLNLWQVLIRTRLWRDTSTLFLLTFLLRVRTTGNWLELARQFFRLLAVNVECEVFYVIWGEHRCSIDLTLRLSLWLGLLIHL